MYLAAPLLDAYIFTFLLGLCLIFFFFLMPHLYIVSSFVFVIILGLKYICLIQVLLLQLSFCFLCMENFLHLLTFSFCVQVCDSLVGSLMQISFVIFIVIVLFTLFIHYVLQLEHLVHLHKVIADRYIFIVILLTVFLLIYY